jgi:hypothetical protein
MSCALGSNNLFCVATYIGQDFFGSLNLYSLSLSSALSLLLPDLLFNLSPYLNHFAATYLHISTLPFLFSPAFFLLSLLTSLLLYFLSAN